MQTIKGVISGVSGPTVTAKGMNGARMHTTAFVGKDGLLGEVVRIQGEQAILQVYEDTTGLSIGEEVVSYGKSLTIRLGPGLLSNVFDGIQRPLESLRLKTGDFIKKGISFDVLLDKTWEFIPKVKKGDVIESGDVVGIVRENERIEHKILVPPNPPLSPFAKGGQNNSPIPPLEKGGKGGFRGIVKEVRKGDISGDEPVVILEDGSIISLYQEWPVRQPRPFKERLSPDTPFITGQRVFDMLFPVAEGGAAIVPGGFGTGKTIVEQALARFAKSDIIVYVGCGERGNEMTEVLTDFPKLLDPSTGLPLSLRTVLIVNTSNMPVAAREASIFIGATIAEYFRDMGYKVALMTDSISRWAEALREISSRMEEMPGEEGYPPYLATRLGNFYERAGKVKCLGNEERTGSVTIVSAVSPPGGDFSEPVTQASLRVAGALWALDTDLAYRRHFPAVDWNKSFSLYYNSLKDWFSKEAAEDAVLLRDTIMKILEREGELKEVVQVVGLEALQDIDRLTMEMGRIVKEVFLRQNVFNDADAFCTMEKQYWMMRCIIEFYNKAKKALSGGIYLEKILSSPVIARLMRMQDIPSNVFKEKAEEMIREMEAGFGKIAEGK
ncbi:MAG: V-type ATP synthase subunit A [Deltaproteobacteria bacterium RIFCSPLOWO2_12_FULL_43_16]|nr:MAG: V-type ATP synthase subunit A [Deltaproteobacteria bacterium GWA2_43_19]OGQ10507.1 MAG: V-type ATP synthase subunit A [Deltaproteobacteria bacterium RIFCSPHIGHO2_02_FULL_43_33]OGQ59505.1 MAG: V-type ATP synthase subunit A [Deltaproteobacteria bacterium RIFCSPLOWO2_12_FULL_43_16]